MCYPLFALIAIVECPAVLRRSSSRAGWRVLVVSALLLALAFYGLAATDARAGTRSWDMAEVASQDGAGNLVVIVRINSPGNNGAISQTNAAGAGANAANTSATNQGPPAAATEPPASASRGAPAPRRPAPKRAAHPPRKAPAAAP